MRVLVWVTDATWPACVDAVGDWVTHDAEIILLHVTDDDVAEVAHGAFSGLLGRGRPRERDPGATVETLSAQAAGQLLADAAARLGRPADVVSRHGRVEHEVVSAADGADLVICARDGDPLRAGPHSLGRPSRFVVDHAPCPVLLVWPHGQPSSRWTREPHPPHGHGHQHRPGHRVGPPPPPRPPPPGPEPAPPPP